MTATLRYFIAASTDRDFLDQRSTIAGYSTASQTAIVTGSSSVNIVWAAPGVDLDVRNLLNGEDLVFFNRNWADYTKDLTSVSGAISFTYTDSGTGLTERVTVLNGATTAGRDKLVFADGSVITNNARSALDANQGGNLNAAISAVANVNVNETSVNPGSLIPSTVGGTLRGFGAVAPGDTTGAVFGLTQPGATTILTGSAQVDTVYASPGSIIDARNLLGGEDIVYFTGTWGSYAKSLTTVSGAIVFERLVDGLTERITVLNGATTAGRDKLVFADGAVITNHARTALDANLGGNLEAAITAVTNYDPATVTPGVDPSLTLFSIATLGDGNLTASEAEAGVVRVAAEEGAAVTLVFTGEGGQTVTKTLTGIGKGQLVALDENDRTILGDGVVSLLATAVDSDGNTLPATTGSFRLDTLPPTLTVAALGDNNLTASEAAVGVINVTTEQGATVTVVFTGQGGNKVTKTITGTGAIQPVILSAGDLATLGNGQVTVLTTARDVAGNVSSGDTTGSFSLDTLLPSLSVVALGDGNLTASEALQPVVSVTAEVDAKVSVVFTGSGGNNVTKTLIGSGSAQLVALAAEELVVLGDGQVTLLTTAEDAAGNVTPGNATGGFRLDTQPPVISVAVGDGNLTADEATAGATTFTTEADAEVTLVFSGADGEVTKTLTGSGAANQPVTLNADDLFILGDGQVSVSATSRDAAGNVSIDEAMADFNLDMRPPEITVANIGDGELTAEEAALGVLSIQAEAGASVSIVLVGSHGNVTMPVTGTGQAETILLAEDDLTDLGEGAVSVVVTATDAAGNVTISEEGGFNLDTMAPVLSGAEVNGNLLTLTYTEAHALDDASIPSPSDFTVLVGSEQVFVNQVSVNGNVVTLALDSHIANGSSVTVSYAGVVDNPIRDVAGNDAAGIENRSVAVPSGSLADGYIRSAQIYIDTNGDGVGNYNTGVTTNASGNFFLPPGTPTGTLIAIGGVNIDTGVANSLIYKAPAGSTMINALTTLVQEYASFNAVSATVAESAVRAKLGLPEGIDLRTFDPLAVDVSDADALAAAIAVQKAAAQIATIAMLAQSALLDGADPDSAAAGVFTNLGLALNATSGNETVDLVGIAASLPGYGDSTEIDPQIVSDAVTAIAAATSFSAIASAQAVILDTIAPAPTQAPDLLAASDSGQLSNDNLTSDNTPTVRVLFDAMATDGTAAVAGNIVKVFNGATEIGSGTLNTNHIANGYIDITVTALSDGLHGLTATLTDGVSKVSDASSVLSLTIDTSAPVTAIESVAISVDTGSSASDFVTKASVQTVHATLSGALAADEFVYGSINSGATWSNITDSVNGTALAWNTVLRSGSHMLQLKVVDSAGNSGPVVSQAYTLDFTAPVLAGAEVNDDKLTLTYTEAHGMDANQMAAVSDFTVLVNDNPMAVENVAVNGNAVVLSLADNVDNGSSVKLSYAGSGLAAIQDLAGNDAAKLSNLSVAVPNGNVADGYIRDARIYIDTNGDGEGDHDTGVFTNASGNFFLPPGTPTGTIIAIGGVNIDTGVPNTLIYKAPAGSTTVSPLTTLVQTYVEVNGGTSADAETAVQTALGLPAGVDLLTFDPLAADPSDADAVAVQKAAAQIATIAMLAASAPAGDASAATAGQDVINNLVSSVKNANDTTGSVNLSNQATAASLLGDSTLVDPDAVSQAAAAIGGADGFTQISNAQSVALDTIAPAAPTHAPDLLAASDSGRLGNDDITHDNTPTVRVRIDTTATDGTAAVAGNQVKVLDGTTEIGNGMLSANDIANGFIDITTSTLSDGMRALSATLTDMAGNVGNASATLNVQIDTVAPVTGLSGIGLSADTGSSANDFVTRTSAQTVSATLSAPLAAGEHVYGSTNGGATWSEITGSVSGNALAWNTVLRSGSHMLQLKVVDSAGNNGPVASQPYTLDLLAPTLAVTGVGDGHLNADEATGAAGVITVNTETGANVGVVFSGTSGTVNKTLVGNGGTQAITLTAGDLATLGNGAVNVDTTAADAAGNTRMSTVGGFNLAVDNSNYSQIFGSPGNGQPYANTVRIQNDFNFHQPGETLVEYVYFDQPVLVNGAPKLQLVIGTAGDMHTVLADYDAANSGGNRVAFNYTLQAGDIGQMSVGNLFMPTGASITNTAGSTNAFNRIDNTGNNQASVWIYGAATQTGTAGNDWIAPVAGADLSDAAKLTAALSGLNAGTGGDRDVLAFDLRDTTGTGIMEGGSIAGGIEGNIGGRTIRILNEGGNVNLYEVVSGTPQLVKALYSPGTGGFERLVIRLTDASGNPLEDRVADMELVSGVYTDLIRDNQMNHGSMFADTITLPANPGKFQMVWPDDGDDVVVGSNNGDHSDVSDGNDSISLGGGDDHFGWWGTGTSTLDGGSGNDTLTLSGGIAPELSGDITHVLGSDGKLYLYAGSTEFAVIEQGGAGDAWQYRITSMEDDPDDMVVTLKDIENFQVGNQSDWLSLVLSTSLFTAADNLAPTSTGATFSNTANSVITLNYSEAVTATSTAGLSLSLNPGEANGWQGTSINLSGMPTGLGTTTVTLPTSSTLTAGDVVRLRYDAGPGDFADLAGNPVPSAEIWIGGSGNNEIDLDDYWSYLPVTLRGNGGNDRLVGTGANDLLLDGGGADTLIGGWGGDSIILVENGSSIAFSRDVVKIEPGESIFGAMDVIRSSATSPTTSGFDIASANAANHDVLDLPSNTVAANAANVDGIDAGGISRHSVTNGIVTFLDASGNPMLAGNLGNANAYLSANFTSPGVTVAFKSDTDSNGVVDSLHVFQDNGTVPLAGGLVLPDTLVRLQNLIGIENVSLGTAAGANVVQIIDTQAPEPVGFALTGVGLQFNFSENAFVPAAGAANLALTMQKNGTGTVFSPSTVDGNGSTSMTLHYALTLTPEDWVMMHYAGTGLTNGIADASGNALVEEAGGFSFAEGGSGNNTINLSALSGDYDINGNAGNDTLIGSSGENWIVGGSGADTLTGDGGRDEFAFEQGDSPAVTARNLGEDGVLNNGDTFSFANGVDRITDLTNDESIELNHSMNDFFGNLGGLSYMGSAPTNGQVADQNYFALQGSFNAGTFTANTAGADTLIVWDGDSSTAVTQTGIVLSGVQAGQLQLGGSWIQLNSTSGFSDANDAYTLPAPSLGLLGQTVDALGGIDTLELPFYPNMIVPDGDGLHFGEVLDLASIATHDIVYTLGKATETIYSLEGIHDVLATEPVADYVLVLQNFERVKFDDGSDELEIDLAHDIGVVSADQAVSGVLDGATLAAEYLFASYEVGPGVTQVIGGAALADTAGFFFDGIEEIQMLKDESGDNPVWRFMEGSDEVFNFTQSGDDSWAVDYASNGAGVDVTFSNIEYLAVMNDLDDMLLRLSFATSQPQVIV